MPPFTTTSSSVSENTTAGAEAATRAPAGWVQRHGLLTECVIAGAGHLAPMDQPARAYDMVVRFIEGEDWGRDEEGDTEEDVVMVVE